jgi:hypothetical protein
VGANLFCVLGKLRLVRIDMGLQPGDRGKHAKVIGVHLRSVGLPLGVVGCCLGVLFFDALGVLRDGDGNEGKRDDDENRSPHGTVLRVR